MPPAPAPTTRSNQSKRRTPKAAQLTNLSLLLRGVPFAHIGPDGNIANIRVGNVAVRDGFSHVASDIVHLSAFDLEVFRAREERHVVESAVFGGEWG